ncbi:MAG: hypothetical protein QOE90_356 [Thermoplasmata archaeon]|nr:hypothetical protein [Thermoplasmata archaeon]
MLARWHYVDDRRTHEVHAGFRQQPRPEFVVREMVHGSQDPAQAVETIHPIAAAWEAKLHHMELEARLAMLGTYWRFDAQQPAAGWTRVKSLLAAADLRPVQETLVPGEMKFYHFHHRVTREDAVLLEIATTGPDGPRTMLARMDFRWPDATQGEIRILARDAAAPLARSLLAREHLALRSRGYEKLLFTQDFLRAHSYGWRRDTLQSYQAMLRRISEGRLDRPRPGDRPPPPVDSTYTDFLRSLTDPRVVALHARFLAPGEEAELMREGDLAIKRAIQRKRVSALREDQLMLNVLEASLLARWGLRPGQRAEVDPEVAAMVRRFAYYL